MFCFVLSFSLTFYTVVFNVVRSSIFVGITSIFRTLLLAHSCRRAFRINSDRFPKRRSGAWIPWKFLDFNSLKSPFVGFWVIQIRYGQFHSPRMKPCKSANSDFVKVNFRVEMRMGARRVQISTWKVFLLLKTYLSWKIRPISVKRWKPVWIRACHYWSHRLHLDWTLLWYHFLLSKLTSHDNDIAIVLLFYEDLEEEFENILEFMRNWSLNIILTCHNLTS